MWSTIKLGKPLQIVSTKHEVNQDSTPSFDLPESVPLTLENTDRLISFVTPNVYLTTGIYMDEKSTSVKQVVGKRV